MKFVVAILAVLILGLIFARLALFTVHETEQTIVLRFGEVRDVRTAPGLYVKLPWENTVTYDKRLLLVDADVQPMPDRDLNFLEIDVYSRYRITDPVRFFATLGDQANAQDRLSQIINASLRDEVALRTREEIIGGQPEVDELGQIVIDAEGNTRVIATESRTEILDRVLESTKLRLAREEGESFGIEIQDVRIKRADFPGEIAEAIFARMISERERIAARLRAEGAEEAQIVRAQAERQREIILANADRDANILRGEGEAEAIGILAVALERDPEFFAFRRSLETYQKLLRGQDTIILSADAPLFQFLGSSGAAVPPVQQVSGQDPVTPGLPAAAGGSDQPGEPDPTQQEGEVEPAN